MSQPTNGKIEQACESALEKIKTLDRADFNDVQAKLEYVLASYRNDHNPVGLYEIGGMALDKLKKLKKEKPRLVSKKLIDDLEKAVASA